MRSCSETDDFILEPPQLINTTKREIKDRIAGLKNQFLTLFLISRRYKKTTGVVPVVLLKYVR